ncbi:HD domain-containing protein [Hahella sp. CCB-MM4]|uniref:HD domain-containing protein n=1 Tax=Hahella sp. (strain CCB-MM4) TaxID=1926491 RepID=UPI000B9C3118|nr:HD domain-containing protein [Hahella sp. CCB-MM4]
MEELIQKAKSYAIGAHRRIDQRRKYSFQPYEHHLKSVADILSQAGADEEMIAAAWLHDVVEDTPATFEDVEREFGQSVAELVRELTDVSRLQDGNRSMRKSIDREHTSNVSDRAQQVKLADLIDNCHDICSHDARFGKVYLEEMRELLRVIRDKDSTLYRRAEKLYFKWDQRLSKKSEEGRGEGAREGIGEEGTGEGQSVRKPRLFPAETRQSMLRTLEFIMTGYCARNIARPAKEPGVSLSENQIVSPEAPLSLVVNELTYFDTCYVRTDGRITHQIRRSDFNSPIAKMWLFGIIIVYERSITELIRMHWAGDSWTSHMSKGRLEKALEFQQERLRRGEVTELLDCLQLSDKFDVIMSNDEHLERYGFSTKAAMKRVVKELGALRNALAHAQDLTDDHWPQIVRISERIVEITGMIPKRGE